jgi:glutathione S-transferase
MVLSIEVPDGYGYVILGCAVLPAFASMYMGGNVIKARKSCDVPLPDLYATPGFHKKADEFNRWQRGHQSFFETLTQVTVCSLIGGLKHPLLAAVSGVCFSLGSVLFQFGYGDTKLDVKTARYQKGGGLKWIGVLLSVGTCISQAGTMCGFW